VRKQKRAAFVFAPATYWAKVLCVQSKFGQGSALSLQKQAFFLELNLTNLLGGLKAAIFFTKKQKKITEGVQPTFVLLHLTRKSCTKQTCKRQTQGQPPPADKSELGLVKSKPLLANLGVKRVGF
jgi:hypothetical protein